MVNEPSCETDRGSVKYFDRKIPNPSFTNAQWVELCALATSASGARGLRRTSNHSNPGFVPNLSGCLSEPSEFFTVEHALFRPASP
jgi:hypothetical protein